MFSRKLSVPSVAATAYPAIALAAVVFLGACVQLGTAPQFGSVATLAGNGTPGSVDGRGTEAQFNRPHGMGLTRDGVLAVADRGNQQLRTVDGQGQVRTLAGSGKAGFGDGRGKTAQFNELIAVVADRAGTLYVADRNNHRIRKVTVEGEVSTLAGTGDAGFVDGALAEARFNQPYGVALSEDEGLLYVADYLNHAIRVVDLRAGRVVTLAGNGKPGFADGKGVQAQFHQPYNVKRGRDGHLYVPDQNNHAVRRVSVDGAVSTVAGDGKAGFADGQGREARFNNPTGITIAPDGTLFVADRNNHRVRRIDPAGSVSTLAGDGSAGFADGALAQAKFNRPLDVELAPDGRLYVSEENNHRIRVIAP